MGTPLDPGIARAIVATLKPLLAKAGYKRKEQTWYSHCPELIRVLEFEAGYSRSIAYFNLGFALRTKSQPTPPRAIGCSVHGRLDALIPTFLLTCDFGQPTSDVESRIKKIKEAVETVALPFLSSIQSLSDLRQAFSTGRLRGFFIPRTARELLLHLSP